ncbi:MULTISPECIES: hypothetical protein [unclassified Gluconobacter]|nr:MULTISPECIES: hypothetical protein [unclassified Gluconobacter]
MKRKGLPASERQPEHTFPLSKEFAMFRKEPIFIAKRFNILPPASRSAGVFSGIEAQFLGLASPGLVTLRAPLESTDLPPLPCEDTPSSLSLRKA